MNESPGNGSQLNDDRRSFLGQAAALEVAAAGLPDHQLGQPLQLLWPLSDAVKPRLSREQAGEAIAQQRALRCL